MVSLREVKDGTANVMDILKCVAYLDIVSDTQQDKMDKVEARYKR